jgi:HlyD family secretion protein
MAAKHAGVASDRSTRHGLVQNLRRRGAVALKLLPVLAAVGAGAYAKKLAPLDADGGRVERGAVVAEVPGTGTLEGAVVAAPGFHFAGRITTLSAEEGERVAAGQPLATLDAETVKQELSVTRANERVAVAAIGRAGAERERARAGLARARADVERVRRLFDAGAVSASERDAAEERFASSEAEVHALDAAEDQADRSRLAAARSVARDERRLADLRLESPFDGIVVRKHREVGGVVAPGMPLYTIASLKKLWVRAWVDETSLGALHVGQPVAVELRSSAGVVHPGRVDRIGKQSDRQTHELLVDVEVLDLPEPFALGQKADVWIATDRRDDAVRVPRGFCDARARTCLVERDGRATRAAVDLGLVGRGFVEVVRGLSPGEVVLRPPRADAALEEGRRVRVRIGP